MMKRPIYAQPANRLLPNLWDILALLIVISVVWTLCFAGSHMSAPYQVGEVIPFPMQPYLLPEYALFTVVRMFIALFFSFLFALVIGTIAAKSPRAEQLIIPMIDILQSVPILAYMSISISGFINLFPGSMWGPECAVIFVVFCSQVWNMTLSVYQSMRSIPSDLVELSHMYRLSTWQKFWKLEVPFAIPSLLWNAMISMSAGWFFIVASEAISINNQKIYLPGIGAYIAQAISHKNIHAIELAIIMMFIVILLYDQLFFRPLLAWSEKFRTGDNEDAQESWFLNILQRTDWVKRIAIYYDKFSNRVVNAKFLLKKKSVYKTHIMMDQPYSLFSNMLWYSCLGILLVLSVVISWKLVFTQLPLHEASEAFLLGGLTALRVFAAVILSTLIWVPIGIYVGMRPNLAKIIQPVTQILAAFPANLFFPVFVICLVYFHLSMNIFSVLLMMLGTQWYVLFNVIAGASMIPKELKFAAKNLQLKGWIKWKRFYLPAIFPFYITGAITAAGGAWNASIVAEFVSWGNTTLIAKGLGGYITVNTIQGNFTHIALGVVMMCTWVVGVNLFFWRKLYVYAEQRFKIDEYI
jgi:NitT/TauT family transport system permease protein